jgi:hypothetical protein
MHANAGLLENRRQEEGGRTILRLRDVFLLPPSKMVSFMNTARQRIRIEISRTADSLLATLYDIHRFLKMTRYEKNIIPGA